MKPFPFWWEEAAPRPATIDRPLPKMVDVLIVGAGYTGLSAARTLAHKGRAVLVIDAGLPGCGASTRNGGMVGAGHRLSFAALEARYGKTLAASLLREAHIEALTFVKALITDNAMECDFRIGGRFVTAWTRQAFEAQTRELERAQTLAPIDAEPIPEHAQHAYVGSDLYAGGILYRRHGMLHPGKFHAGLLALAQAAGAAVIGETPVLALETEKGVCSVRTAEGVIRARQVLLATNGYTGAAFSRWRRRIVPTRSYIVASEPFDAARAARLMPPHGTIVETRHRHCYFRLSPDGRRLLFGGRAALKDIAPERAQATLSRLIREIYPTLAEIRFTHSWRGNVGHSFAGLPHFGRLTAEEGAGGIWHAMGYCGNGVAMAPYMGHRAALQMLGGKGDASAFSCTGFASRWWHVGAPWFLPAADALFRLHDWRDNRLKRTERREPAQ